MQEMNFSIYAKRFLRQWPRVEKYQNSTLRFSPPKDFPSYWVGQNARPAIIRTWVTLDEIWNLLTDEYDWNYQIGVDKLGEKRYYPYDWTDTRPSDTHFEDYLTSYCAMAEEAMLVVRRFERELADGILSVEKYEEVVEKVLEHCCDLCANIRYIEVSNESEAPEFGGLTIPEYIRMYDAVSRVVTRLNRRRGWDLQVGGNAMTDKGFFRGKWHEFMQALAQPGCPERRIDFYAFHQYHTDTYRLQQLVNAHRADVKKYGLPDAPLFLDEYGTQRCSGEPIEGLKNASRVLIGLLRSADMEDVHIFPWCTFHNPQLQMSFTQYIRLDDGSYAPTPNGMSMQMLHRMLRDEVTVKNDLFNRVRATVQDNRIFAIVSNPDETEAEVNCTLRQLEGRKARIAISQVDEKHNNAVMNPPCMQLDVTQEMELEIADGDASFRLTLPRFGFACISVETE